LERKIFEYTEWVRGRMGCGAAGISYDIFAIGNLSRGKLDLGYNFKCIIIIE